MLKQLGGIIVFVSLITDTVQQLTVEFQNGPDPSDQSLSSAGPFQFQTKELIATSEIDACTLYSPVTENGLAGIVVYPGFLQGRDTMATYSKRIASHGFNVLNCDTINLYDQPEDRGQQIQKAIDVLKATAGVDGSRIGVSGHSMGGGGTLEAIQSDSSILAAVPLTPWNLDKDFSSVTTPTLIIGAQNDTIASVTAHSLPFYKSLGGKKAYLELIGASHFAPYEDNVMISKFSVAWFKTFLDNDSRYVQFVCPGPVSPPDTIVYESECVPTPAPVPIPTRNPTTPPSKSPITPVETRNPTQFSSDSPTISLEVETEDESILMFVGIGGASLLLLGFVFNCVKSAKHSEQLPSVTKPEHDEALDVKVVP